MSSIRDALRVGLVLATVATFVAAGVATERGVRRALLDDLDRNLRQRALWIESTVELAPEGLDLGFREFALHEFEAGAGASLLQLTQPSGEVLYRSPSLGSNHLAQPREAPSHESVGFERTADGRRVRTYRARFLARMDPEMENPPARPPLLIALGRDMSEIEALLGRLRVLLAVVGLAAVLMMLAFIRWVVHRSLRPLERIAGEIGALDTTQLTRRLDTARVPLELVPVVQRLNELLDRVHASFERERTFGADIAHELRTPMAGLRTSLEVELSRPRNAESYQETMRGALTMLLQMQALVETLLQLARLDAGIVSAKWADTDLAALTRASLATLEPRARGRGLDVRATLDRAAPLHSDPALLATAVRNILENAVSHARSTGPVEITVTPLHDRVQLCVRNHSEAMMAADVPRLFERFARRDDARGAAGGHYGLGLALVKRITTALNGQIQVSVEPTETFELTLSVPLTPPSTRGMPTP